jgi:hypothetical protein
MDNMWISDLTMAYWKDWLVTHDIPVEQLDPTLLRKWVLRMEEVVGAEMQYAIPEEWSALADHNNDNNIEINLGDLPHENDEDD